MRGYRDLERIGRGGFSVVYRATQESLGRTVAVKMMLTDLTQPDDVRRFTNECAILGRLGAHKHVVDVYDAGITDDGRPFIVMKLYERGTLADTVRANGPLPVADVVDIGSKLASALQAAHDIGVIHRDIKPDNVLLDDDLEPVLSDFGVAAVADAAGQYTTSVAFSRAHVAPEVLDRNEFGVTSDVYSLGSTLYTLLTGRAAFEASTEARQIVAIMTAPVPEITRHGVPPELAELIADSLAKEPSERVQTAGELRRRLESVDLSKIAAAPSAAATQDPPEPVQAVPMGTAIGGRVAQPGTNVGLDEFELTRRRPERSPVAAAPMAMSAAADEDEDVEVTRRKAPAAPVPVSVKGGSGDAAPPAADPPAGAEKLLTTAVPEAIDVRPEFLPPDEEMPPVADAAPARKPVGGRPATPAATEFPIVSPRTTPSAVTASKTSGHLPLGGMRSSRRWPFFAVAGVLVAALSVVGLTQSKTSGESADAGASTGPPSSQPTSASPGAATPTALVAESTATDVQLVSSSRGQVLTWSPAQGAGGRYVVDVVVISCPHACGRSAWAKRYAAGTVARISGLRATRLLLKPQPVPDLVLSVIVTQYTGSNPPAVGFDAVQSAGTNLDATAAFSYSAAPTLGAPRITASKVKRTGDTMAWTVTGVPKAGQALGYEASAGGGIDVWPEVVSRATWLQFGGKTYTVYDYDPRKAIARGVCVDAWYERAGVRQSKVAHRCMTTLKPI